jgi:predicted SnoaL-like aldol condensation-catalyzing enzyme
MRSVKYWLAAAFSGVVVAMNATAGLADPSDQQVNDTRAFIEYAFGFQLDGPTVQLIRDGLTRDMAKNESGSMATLNDMNTFMSYVHSHPAASGALLRTYVEPELVAAFQADTSDATSKALVAAWRAHNHIIADGRPPLRKGVVDSYIAMFEFISKQAGKQVRLRSKTIRSLPHGSLVSMVLRLRTVSYNSIECRRCG